MKLSLHQAPAHLLAPVQSDIWGVALLLAVVVVAAAAHLDADWRAGGPGAGV
jgi:flagellin-like protein